MTPRKKVTLKEIAVAANLAVPTVSQILNGKKNFCSEQKIKEVKQIAHDLGYVPNIGYRIMIGQETNTIGVMVSSSTAMQEYFIRAQVLKLLDGFSRRGCVAFCQVMERSDSQAVNAVKETLGRGATRLVFVGAPCGMEEIFDLLDKKHIPYISDTEICQRYVTFDAETARIRLYNYLDRKTGGNFKICWPNDTYWRQNILPHAADPEYLADKLVKITPQGNGSYYDNCFAAGYEFVKELTARDPQLRGIAFPNDSYAHGAAMYLYENGRDDFYLAGCNGDSELRRFPYPVATGFFDTGKIAELMVERSFDNGPCRISVPVELQIRGKAIPENEYM